MNLVTHLVVVLSITLGITSFTDLAFGARRNSLTNSSEDTQKPFYTPYIEKKNAKPFTKEELSELEAKLLVSAYEDEVRDIAEAVFTRNGAEAAGQLIYQYIFVNLNFFTSSKNKMILALEFLRDNSKKHYDQLLTDLNQKNFPKVFEYQFTNLDKQRAILGALSEVYGAEAINKARENFNARNPSKSNALIKYQGPIDIRKKIRDEINSLDNSEESKNRFTILNFLLNTITRDFSSEVGKKVAANSYYEPIGRENELDELLDAYIRLDASIPLIIGPSGVGISTLVEDFARAISQKDLPSIKKYESTFGNTRVIEISANRILLNQNFNAESFYASFNYYLNTVETDKNLIVAIDKVDRLPPLLIEELHRLAPMHPKIKLLFTGNPTNLKKLEEFSPQFISRKLRTILLNPLKKEDVAKHITEYVFPKMKVEFGVSFDEASLEFLIKGAEAIHSNMNILNASQKIIEDIAIETFKKNANYVEKSQAKSFEVSQDAIFKYIEKSLGVPVNPYDSAAFKKYIETLTENINKDIVGQERMNHDLVHLWANLLRDNSTNVKVAMLLGPTGTGKTELGKAIAIHALHNHLAFLEIDGNALKEKEALTSLVGAPNGYLSSDKTQGLLGDFLTDNTKGGKVSIILVNELEKANPAVAERLMEFLDSGNLQLGNGTIVRPKKSLVVFTSNKADDLLYPKGMNKWSLSEVTKYMSKFTSNDLKEVFTSNQGGRSGHSLHNSIVNRFDLFSAANPIVPETADLIASKMAQSLIKLYKAELNIDITISNDLIKHLTHFEYDMSNGARPIVKRVKSYLNDAIAEARENFSLQAGSKLQIQLVEKDGPKIKVIWGKKSTLIDAPKAIIDDPYQDKELIAKLAKLEENLNKDISGHEKDVAMISKAVSAHLLTPNPKHALSFTIVGTSGSGKTHTAKSLAKAIYGDESRLGILDMGQIQDKHSVGRFFGVEPGFEGGKEIGLFESILLNNPMGAVIVFDEVSNMGGNDLSVKNALFKLMYAIADEPTWTSPNTKKVYDLTKHIFINTGNDGEELFNKHTTDFMRMKIYDESRSQEDVAKLLKANGIPEAFLGRQAKLILWKPLLSTDTLNITKRAVEKIKKITSSRGVKLKLSDEFVKQVSEVFFFPTKGGRSVEEFVSNTLKAAIDHEVFEAIKKTGSTEGLSVEVKLLDNLPLQPYKPSQHWLRNVELQTIVKKSNKIISQSNEDVTGQARVINLRTKEYTSKTAYHEAGHAIVNNPDKTGLSVDFITVKGADFYWGLASYEEIKKHSGKQPTKDSMIWALARLRAGGLAQKMAGFDLDAGWRNDMEKVNSLLHEGIVEYALDKRFQVAGKTPSEAEKALINEISKDWLLEADRLAISTLQKNWNVIRAITFKLLEKGTMYADEFEQVVRDAKELEATRGDLATKWRVSYKLGANDIINDLTIIRLQKDVSSPMSCKKIFE